MQGPCGVFQLAREFQEINFLVSPSHFLLSFPLQVCWWMLCRFDLFLENLEPKPRARTDHVINTTLMGLHLRPGTWRTAGSSNKTKLVRNTSLASNRRFFLFGAMSSDHLSRPVLHRKSHRHSKTGCLTCKTRRVKCDEARPICTSCAKRQEACVWSNNPNALLILPRIARAALKPSKDHQLSLPPLSEFRPKELELLHNWTTNTIFTFIPGLPVTQHGFQVSLPQIAFQHEFLLHAMFAITSLHMNHLLPSPNCLLLAKTHCQRAVLGGFADQQNSASPEAIIMASMLLATYWLALPAWESTGQSHFPDVFNWLPAARTCMGKVQPYHQDLLDGAFPFLPQNYPGAPSMLTPFPDIFYHIYDPQLCPFDTEELDDPQTLAAYGAAFFSIINYSWDVFMEPGIQTFTIYRFLCAVPDEFFKLFLEHRPRALIIVAHYCTLLGQLDELWCYSWERCRHDLQRILSLLDEKWLPCMEYPLNVLAMRDQPLGDAVNRLDGPKATADKTDLNIL